MREHARERLHIRHAFGPAALDRILELGCRVPDYGIFKMEPWREASLAVVGCPERRRVQVEKRHARRRAGLVRLSIGASGRHERELMDEASQPRKMKTVDRS